MLIDLYDEQGRYLGQFHEDTEPPDVLVVQRDPHAVGEIYVRSPPPGRMYCRAKWRAVLRASVRWTPPAEDPWQQPDWTCPECVTANLAVRRKCRNCGAPKPDLAGKIVCTECLHHGPNRGTGHSSPMCKYVRETLDPAKLRAWLNGFPGADDAAALRAWWSRGPV